MKNIFQIWSDNGKVLPMAVSKGNWSDERIYVIVTNVIPDGKGYGKAYGIPVANGVTNSFFNYNKQWCKDEQIPNAGTYNWVARNDKSLQIEMNIVSEIENKNNNTDDKSKEELDIDDVINFGKYKGQTIDYVLKNDISYLKWALKNVKSFKANGEVREQVEKK